MGEAVAKAKTALENAEKALEDAKEIAADNAALIDVLEEAIKAATGDLKTATGQLEGADLKNAVAEVEGEDEDKPKSADDIGEAVAMDVGGALMPNTNGGRSDRAPHTAPAAVPTAMNAVKMSDQLGHTWAQIVGADNLSPKPLGTDRATVMVSVDSRHDRYRRA